MPLSPSAHVCHKYPRLTDDGRLIRWCREELPHRYTSLRLAKRPPRTDFFSSRSPAKASHFTAQFVQNVWIESYDPTIEDSYRKQIEVDVRDLALSLQQPPSPKRSTPCLSGFKLTFSTCMKKLTRLSVGQAMCARNVTCPTHPKSSAREKARNVGTHTHIIPISQSQREITRLTWTYIFHFIQIGHSRHRTIQ